MPKTHYIKGNVDELELIKIKNFYSETYLGKRMKRQGTDWEKKFFKLYADQRTNTQNANITLKIQQLKKKI